MNERDLKVTCKEIKGFDSLIRWQIVEFVLTTLYGSLFIHLPFAIILLGNSISAMQSMLKRSKLRFFFLFFFYT